ncbi:type IV pilin [Haloarcula sp. AONF1]
MGSRRGVDAREHASEERAVSKVVGVVLMTAIVIALAATVATMLTGFAGLLNEPAPQVAFEFEYDDDVENPKSVYDSNLPDNTEEVVAVRHMGGDQFDPENVEIIISWTHEGSDNIGQWRDTWANAATGQTSTVRITGNMYAHVWGDATFENGSIQVVWNDPNKSRSVLLAEWNGPKNNDEDL